MFVLHDYKYLYVIKPQSFKTNVSLKINANDALYK